MELSRARERKTIQTIRLNCWHIISEFDPVHTQLTEPINGALVECKVLLVSALQIECATNRNQFIEHLLQHDTIFMLMLVGGAAAKIGKRTRVATA